MLDIKLLRETPDVVKADLRKRGRDEAVVDELLAHDAAWRAAQQEQNDLRAERNQAAKAIASAKKAGEDAQPAIAAMGKVGAAIKAAEQKVTDAAAARDALLRSLPNIMHESVPVGADDTQNVLLRDWGGQPTHDFEAASHVDLLDSLDVADLERAARVAGSRFAYLKGDLVLMARGLEFLALEHLSQKGFTPVEPPYMLRREAVEGAVDLSDFEDVIYRVETGLAGDGRGNADGSGYGWGAGAGAGFADGSGFGGGDGSGAGFADGSGYGGPMGRRGSHDPPHQRDAPELFLIATSEHPLAALHMGEIFEDAQLPLKYAGVSPCFRKEAGAHGKDSKGIFRVHQFSKVEQFVYATQEDSWDIHEELLANAEELYQKLEIPYRVVTICTGDLGTVAAKKYDIEAWMPVQGAYREVVSCSNCTDYQARRYNTRHRKAPGEPTAFVHTLNSTAIAVQRTLVAILENFQNEDGSVTIPKVLRPYVGGRERIEPSDPSSAQA